MIIVFGSINMDVNMRLAAFPKPGETVLAPAYDMGPGGKGANQAMAAARSGVKTVIVGKVGDDGMGTRILNNLRRNEVLTSGVATSESLPTGMAFVMADKHGENQIIVASGANSDVAQVQVPDEILTEGNVLLLQMEVPHAENATLLARAKERGVTTILNLAPAFVVDAGLFAHIDYLVCNAEEALVAAQSLGISPDGTSRDVGKRIAEKGNVHCLITLGAEGSVLFSPSGKGWQVGAYKGDAPVIDTTGAGDCYCGTFAAGLHEKLSVPESMRRASVAASLSCTRKGAQDSYHYFADVNEALATMSDAVAIS